MGKNRKYIEYGATGGVRSPNSDGLALTPSIYSEKERALPEFICPTHPLLEGSKLGNDSEQARASRGARPPKPKTRAFAHTHRLVDWGHMHIKCTRIFTQLK
jgi:hypothetical protein